MPDTSKITIVRFPNVPLAFTATNVLSKEECDNLAEVAEISGFRRSGESDGPHFAGNRMRASFMNAPMAEILFERLGSCLPSSHEHDNLAWEQFHLLGPRAPSGTYTPIGVNEFFRISKYVPNGHFGKHTDTGYVRDDQYVGFWTLLLYLNDGFDGGETVIWDNNNKVEIVTPEIGKVFAFYHYQDHAGCKVESGSKLCLRTEIMFAHVKQPAS